MNKVEGIRNKGLLPTQWDCKDLNTVLNRTALNYKRGENLCSPMMKTAMVKSLLRLAVEIILLLMLLLPVIADEVMSCIQLSAAVSR